MLVYCFYVSLLFMRSLEGKYKEYFSTPSTHALLFKLITIIVYFFLKKNPDFNNFFLKATVC